MMNAAMSGNPVQALQQMFGLTAYRTTGTSYNPSTAGGAGYNNYVQSGTQSFMQTRSNAELVELRWNGTATQQAAARAELQRRGVIS